MNGELERVRREFLPEKIRILMLGESPPPHRGFFYTGDSTLYKFSVPVFRDVCGFPTQRDKFLRAFKGAGFYLEDFSSVRGDHPHEKPESPDVSEAIDRLASVVTQHRPQAVIGVLKRLEPLVAQVVENSEEPTTPWVSIAFPHHKNERSQHAFGTELKQVLEAYGCS